MKYIIMNTKLLGLPIVKNNIWKPYSLTGNTYD